MIKALKIAGIALAALVLLTAGTAAWLAGTQNGTRFALRRAEAVLPPGIDLGTVNGRLADRLELTGVTIAAEGFELTIARLRLDWSPGDLLSRRLSIADLGVEGVRYRALPADTGAAPAEEPEPFTLPARVELPVSVRVGRLSVENVEAVTEADGEPIQIERLLLENASFADGRLELAVVEVESPFLSATGRTTVVAADEYPLDATVEWRVRLPDYAPVAGVTTLDGSLAELNVEQHIAAPYGSTLTGVVRDLVDPDETLNVDLQLDIADLRLSEIQPELPDASLGLGARFEGTPGALNVDVDATGVDPEQRRFTAALSAMVEPEAVTIRRLAVRQPGRDGELEGAGRIALAEEATADLAISWSALQWPLTGEPIVVSPRGTLAFEGPPSGYQLELDARLEPTAAPPVNLRLDGEGDTTSAALTVDAQEREGMLTGRVNVVWAPSLSVDATLQASNFDPSPFAADWPGAVDLALEASARVDGDDANVSVGRLEAGGTLRGLPLSVVTTGRFSRDGGAYAADIEQLDAALGDARLDVRGRVSERADIEWRLVSEDLASVFPQAAGRIDSSGRISGPMPQVQIAANIEGRDLAFDEHRLAILDLRADLDLSGQRASELAVTARDAEVAGLAVGALVIEAVGTAAQHEIRLALDAEPSSAELRMAGRLDDAWQAAQTWHFTLSDGEVAYAPLAPWRLAASASGSVDAERLSLERQCWQAAEEARLCLQGHRDPSGLAADIDVEELAFGYLAAFLPDGVELRGGVSGSAQVSQTAGEPLSAEAVVAVSESEVRLRPEAADEDAVTLRVAPSELSAGLDDTGARVRATLNFEHGRFNLQADTVPPAAQDTDSGASVSFAAHDLNGSLDLMLPDLSFVSELVPTLEDVEGRLGGALQISGTVGEPAVSGALELENGSLFVSDTGITLTELRATLEGLGRDIMLSASAASGGGDLTIGGRMSLPGDALEARLDIEGNAFQVVNNDDARIFLSPRLEVEANEQRLSVTGEVNVPRAELTPGEQPPSAVAVSSDQVLLSDEPEAQAAAARDLFAEIRVRLGDDVHFAGLGLTARIEGDLLVSQEPRTPTTATGELRILDGEYRAYGQGLVIESGRIYFAGGPITQPALDVRAVRRPREDILVGANVSGTLESPSFELFSEPSMTQQEQLAWLVLGRSLQEAPEGEGDALSQAALAMGLRGGDFLAKNIGERIGFDQFGIETGSGEAGAQSDPSDAALVVGKYLSPKLFVSYGIGLFTPESVLEMQYEISRRWTVVTQSSGDATGGDVLYTVEFGR